jgi:hypothetical protein
MTDSSRLTHYHTLDLVNGADHFHRTIADLDQYLRATVPDDKREYLIDHAQRLKAPYSLGCVNMMRVRICGCADGDDES